MTFLTTAGVTGMKEETVVGGDGGGGEMLIYLDMLRQNWSERPLRRSENLALAGTVSTGE